MRWRSEDNSWKGSDRTTERTNERYLSNTSTIEKWRNMSTTNTNRWRKVLVCFCSALSYRRRSLPFLSLYLYLVLCKQWQEEDSSKFDDRHAYAFSHRSIRFLFLKNFVSNHQIKFTPHFDCSLEYEWQAQLHSRATYQRLLIWSSNVSANQTQLQGLPLFVFYRSRSRPFPIPIEAMITNSLTFSSDNIDFHNQLPIARGIIAQFWLKTKKHTSRNCYSIESKELILIPFCAWHRNETERFDDDGWNYGHCIDDRIPSE